MTITIERLEENIAILDYDIKELRDMIQRYYDCNSAELVELAKNLYTSCETLQFKQNKLHHQLVEMKKRKENETYFAKLAEDDFLQDYREILA